MMKILHVITNFDLGGSERVALNIAKSDSKDFQYHIVEIVKTSGEFRKKILRECKDSGVVVHTSSVKYKKIAILLFSFWFLFTMLKVRPNVIHCHTEIPDLSIFIWKSLFGWMFPRVKYVRTIHNTELWNEWKWIGKIVEKFFKRYDANVAISESTKKSYLDAYNGDAPIIFNGVGETLQKSFDSIVVGKRNILFAGRLEPQKGIDELCEVVRRMEKNESIFFHIVGNGSSRDKIDSLRSLSNVYIYDKVYGLSQYLEAFDYVFMPSNFEGLGLLSVEASLAKVPTIINQCSGLNETLPENWPLKVERNSVNQFIAIFNNLDSFDKKELGLKAYNFAKEHFSIKKCKANMNVYTCKSFAVNRIVGRCIYGCV